MRIALSLAPLAREAKAGNGLQSEMLQCNEAFGYSRLEAPAMSKQLTLSATLSVIAMTALAFGTLLASPASGGESHAATAHGSLVKVLIRA